MTVEEIMTKFSFKADTAKAEKFEKVTSKMKSGMQQMDNAWVKMNSKLSQGFQSRWFDQFATKVTDLRRVQLFLGGIRRGFDFASKVIPGLGSVSNVVTSLTMKYNKFSQTLVNARSAIRSFGVLLGNSVHGILPMVKAELASMTTLLRTGFSKALTFLSTMDVGAIFNRIKTAGIAALNAIGTAAGKVVTFIRGGFGKLHQFLLDSNNAFLNKIGGMITRIQTTAANIKGISALGSKIQALTANIPGIGKLTSSFSAFGLGATAALAGIVAGVIAAIAAIKKLVAKIKESTRDFLNFESGMKGVQRVTLASTEDMKKLEEAALKAGEASIFGVKDAADAEKFLAMAGLSVDEVIGALPGTLQLAAAAEMDLATAADIATNIMSSNALGVEDLTRINDVLAYSASNSNQNVMQLGAAIKNIGPAGRLAGVGIEDLSSWLSVLANNGLRGEEAGTMVRNAIMDLTNPSKAMSARLKQAGVDMKNFVDSTGKINNIYDLLNALQSMDEAKRAKFLGVLDARTYRALAPIITGNVKAMQDFNAELSKSGGTAQKMADLAFTGLTGAIAEYKSQMETANVNFIKDSGLNDLFEEFVRFGTATLPVIWNTLGLVLKPFVKLLTIAMKIIRGIFTFLGGAFKVLNSIARAVLGIIDVALKPILDAIDQLIKGVKDAFALLADLTNGPLLWVKKIFDWIGKVIATIVKGIMFIFGPLLFMVDLLLNIFLIMLPNAINNFFDMLQKKWDESFLGKLANKAGGFISGLNDKLGTGTAGQIVQNVSNTFSEGAPVPVGNPSGGYARMMGTAPTRSETKNLNIDKLNTQVTVQGGITNSETAAAVSEAVNQSIAAQLRHAMQEMP